MNFTVDGFTEIKKTGNIIGAGISDSVDSPATIYDQFVCENEPAYKINALFYFNHDRKNFAKASTAESMFKILFPKNQKIAQALNLPCCPLETNLPVFNITINRIRRHVIISTCRLSIKNNCGGNHAL